MSPDTSPTTSPGPPASRTEGQRQSPFGKFNPGGQNNELPGMDKIRSISFAGPSVGPKPPPLGERRMSIQFAPNAHKPADIKIAETLPPVKERRTSRLPSPPPPSAYKTRAAFDTINNPAVADPSFTLVSKHAGYTYTRHQRVFLVAIDQNDYSDFALKWLVEEMIEDGDEIICLRVVEREGKSNAEPVALLQRNYKKDARRLLDRIHAANNEADNKAISIVLEFATGNVEENIQRMISIYSPAFLTVGTRGRSLGGIQGLLPGSVSKWCMQNSPVPVVTARHPDKRRKKMQKRMNDPSRRGYSSILDQSTAAAAAAAAVASASSSTPKLLDGGEKNMAIEPEDYEADAVARAIGLKSRLSNWKGFGAAAASGSGGIKSGKKGEESDGEEEENDSSDHDHDAEDEHEDGEEEEESEDEEEEGGLDTPSPMGAILVEGHGIEDMPNYVPGAATATTIATVPTNDSGEGHGSAIEATTTTPLFPVAAAKEEEQHTPAITQGGGGGDDASMVQSLSDLRVKDRGVKKEGEDANVEGGDETVPSIAAVPGGTSIEQEVEKAVDKEDKKGEGEDVSK